MSFVHNGTYGGQNKAVGLRDTDGLLFFKAPTEVVSKMKKLPEAGLGKCQET